MKGWFAEVGKFSQLGPNAMRHFMGLCRKSHLGGVEENGPRRASFFPTPPYLPLLSSSPRSNRLAGTKTNDDGWMGHGDTCAVLRIAYSVAEIRKYLVMYRMH
jgi:hypothetical protein